MITLLQHLWRDEAGYLMSAEAVTVGTVGIVGATVGLGALSKSVNDELTETAYAIRSLDQSYNLAEQRGAGAWTAGSAFAQPNADQSRAALDRFIRDQGGTPIDHSPVQNAAIPVKSPIEDHARLQPQQSEIRSPEEREELRRIRQRQRREQQSTTELPAVPLPIETE